MSQATPTQSGFAEVNGARIAYEVAGTGRPVVLIHAGICDQRMWDEQFALFAERYRVIRYDQRGFGQSTLPPGPYSQEEDLAALLARLGVSEAAVIGVSMGGAGAINLALAHPALVKALVVVGAGVDGAEVPVTPEEEALFGEVETAANQGDIEMANAREADLWVAGPHRDPATVDARIRERVRAMNFRGFQEAEQQKLAKRQPIAPPANERLGDIHIPTLVIVGDQDFSDIQTLADLIASGIPGARKVVIPDTAHLPNMERPEAFNRIVLDFLASAGW